jgi:hypothetical protein
VNEGNIRITECNIRDDVNVTVMEEEQYCLYLSQSALCVTARRTFNVSSHTYNGKLKVLTQLQNQQLNIPYSSPNIITAITSNGMRLE